MTLKARAWDTFSKYIRLRDPMCITCTIEGRQRPSQNAGHFWHNVLDFDEENINGQCINCNHYNSGNLAQYSVYLLRKLGKKKFEALDIRHTRALSGEYRTAEDYKKIIETYENKIKELQTL